MTYPENTINSQILSFQIFMNVPVGHCYLPVCLLKLFSLVWVLSLFLSAFPLLSPFTYFIVYFWFSMGAFLVGCFLFVDYDRMVFIQL